MTFEELPDLAQDTLGGAAIECSDDFFAPMENLVRARAPEWREHEYTDRSKWMDGWESRRKRLPGHDWRIVRLGAPTIVHGVVVDTSYFRGNFPSHASLDGCFARRGERLSFTELLARAPLDGDRQNAFEIAPRLVTHVRLNIFPDGGVARLRVHGRALPDFRRAGSELDVAAIENGGRSLGAATCSSATATTCSCPGAR